MNLTALIRSALAVGVALLNVFAFAPAAVADYPLEIIGLRHRTADQVLPALRPLLEPGATLTGQRDQLIVRTSPQNLAELRQALEAIDRPLRRLIVSVRFDQAGASASQGIAASARIGQRGSDVQIRAHESQASSAERVDQRIQVLEGSSAFIATGQSTPIMQGSVIYESASGFEARPRVAGDRVLIDIAPRRESLREQFGAATTLTTRLGEWVEVGAVAQQSVSSSHTARVWLKVEEAR